MKAYAVVVCLGFVLVLCAGAQAQFMTAPVPDNCISVMAGGSAKQPADWLDIHVSMQSSAPSAETAMTMNRDDDQRAYDKLVASGIAEESITSSPPSLSGGGVYAMARQDAERQWFANSTITVRMTKPDPGTMYEDAGRIVDLVASVAKVNPQGANVMVQAMVADNLFEFGVNDPAALRDKAMADALKNAQATAAAAAANAGKKLGPLVSVSVIDQSLGAMASIVRMFESKPTVGEASMSVMITATYKLE